MATHSAAAIAASASSWAKRSETKPIFKPVTRAIIASNFKPTKQQQDYFDWIENGSGSLILAALAGTGKCLGKDTPILMFDGSIKAVQDVGTGDVLMGMNSDPKTVLSTTTGVSPLYKITPVKGDAWVCNDVHVLTLKQSVTKEIFDISLPEYLACNNNYKVHDAKQFRVGVNFTSKETICAPYLLGVWLGDGSIAGPRISLPDQEIMNYLVAEAPNYGLTAKVTYPEGKCPNIDLTGIPNHTNILRDEFKTCVINGEKRIPSQYLTNSREKRLELLAGLLDTDCFLTNGMFEIITKYMGLRDDILFLARSLGFAAYSSVKKGIIKSIGFTGYYWRITISGHTNLIPTKIARKKAAPRMQKKDVLNTGFRVDAMGTGDYYGFTLDGDGRFLLGDFTVTHNTSSLIEGLEYMRGRIFLGAYNKKIVEELQSRVPNSPNVKIATMHSVGYGYLKQIVPDAQLDYNKMRDIYRLIAGYDKQLKGHEAAVLSLVSFAKQSAIGIMCSIDDKDAWYEQIDYYNIDCNNEHDVVIFNAIRTLKRSIELCTEKIDFEDMIYYPLLKNAVKPTYDWVLADELNDYNATRRMMAIALLKPTGRFVGAGDVNQSIYQFSGADHNSIDLMRSATNAATLPLSICFRCAKAVIAEAQKYVPEIEAREGAPEGIVRWAAFETIFDEVKIGDAILCRYNAPLVELAYHFILKGVPAKIEGKDIGANLKALAKKWVMPKTLLEYRAKLHDYMDKNVAKFKEEGKDYLAEALSDKVKCLDVVITRLLIKKAVGKPTDILGAEIDAIFGETVKGDPSTYVVLSSRHKSKGLEWSKIFNLVHTPSKRKLQDFEVIAEKNLNYVAITRAKHELVYMHLPKMK